MAVIVKPPCDEAAILTGVAEGSDTTCGRWVLDATILGSSLAFIDGMDRRFLDAVEGDLAVESAIHNYETAYRMQAAVPELV